jgi:hypothetical protein
MTQPYIIMFVGESPQYWLLNYNRVGRPLRHPELHRAANVSNIGCPQIGWKGLGKILIAAYIIAPSICCLSPFFCGLNALAHAEIIVNPHFRAKITIFTSYFYCLNLPFCLVWMVIQPWSSCSSPGGIVDGVNVGGLRHSTFIYSWFLRRWSV